MGGPSPTGESYRKLQGSSLIRQKHDWNHILNDHKIHDYLGCLTFADIWYADILTKYNCSSPDSDGLFLYKTEMKQEKQQHRD